MCAVHAPDGEELCPLERELRIDPTRQRPRHLGNDKHNENRPEQNGQEAEGPRAVPEASPILDPNEVNPEAHKDEPRDDAGNE
jgi:hypothetical protein